MRRAFTLIELMITILLSTIFLNFVFRFYTNIFVELSYLEAKDSLIYNGFRTLQIVKNGVYDKSRHISGLITLDSMSGNDNNFTANSDARIKIDLKDNNLLMIDESNKSSYRMSDINISNVVIKNISNGLYSIEFNATKNTNYKFSELNQTEIISFQRLVYTK
jgi:prepilin-type N-terminal cleavage/methylation domain-containing protein